MALAIGMHMLATPSRPVPVVTDRPMLWRAAACLAALGAVVVLVVTGDWARGLGWMALIAAGPVPLLYALSRHWRDAEARVTVVDGRATVRTSRHYAAGMVFAMACLAGQFAWMGLPTSGPGRYVMLCVALVPAILLPDLVRIALIRTDVTFDADTLRLRTFGFDLHVRWTEVESVMMCAPAGTGSAVTVLVTPEAAARVRRRPRLLFSWQPRSMFSRGFAILPFTMDEPWLLYAQLAHLATLDRAGRDGYLRAAGPDLMAGRRSIADLNLDTVTPGPLPRKFLD